MNGLSAGSESAFADYVHRLVDVIGHADRAEPLNDYCLGLMLPVERKSVEPLAAVTAPARVSAKHQSLLHFVGQAPWSDEALLARVRDLVLPLIERHGPIEAWIVDDTGFPKKGRHSVGVARQYCGQLGKQDNCQVAVSLSVANAAASLPIAYRLYLPEIWADDPERRRKAKIPDSVAFQTKPAIALDQIRAAQAAGVAPGVVLADAGYGADGAFPHRPVGARPRLCRGRATDTQCLATRRGTIAAQAVARKGAANLIDAAQPRSQADFGESAGAGAAAGSVADYHLAGRNQHRPWLPVRRRARPTRIQGLQSDRAPCRGMAADRMA
jgi:hypothetical protein